jgi:acyl-CoA thioester hydrolase
MGRHGHEARHPPLGSSVGRRDTTEESMKLEIPEIKKLVHEMVMPIRWGDMDAMGHLNNASYMRFMETIRIEWFTHIGCDPNPQGQGPVIVNVFCNFYKQLQYPCDVHMKMYVSDAGRSSFESWATFEPVDQPRVIHAAGGATTIWVDFPAQKSAPLPEWMRAHIT